MSVAARKAVSTRMKRYWAASWLTPDHRYFKVRTAERDTCILRHDVALGEWELTLFFHAARRQRISHPHQDDVCYTHWFCRFDHSSCTV
jgi:hypothetical protein